MRKLLLLPLAAALVLVGPAGAARTATVNISIKSTAFAPKSVTINYHDSVTWKNNDKSNHQVVANDGSFASPILGPGKTYTHQFNAAGHFYYHDAIKTSLKGAVHVKGPPPSVSLALSVPIIPYGASVTISGQISSHASGQNVTITAQPYGTPSPVVLATVVTGADGTFGYVTKPSMYTTYTSAWKNATSTPVIAQVAPRVTLRPGRNGTMRAQVVAGRSFYHRHLFLQRLSRYGQWVNVTALTLGPHSGKIFKPRPLLPKGISRIRVFLTVNQAGIGLLSAHSGLQTLYHS